MRRSGVGVGITISSSGQKHQYGRNGGRRRVRQRNGSKADRSRGSEGKDIESFRLRVSSVIGTEERIQQVIKTLSIREERLPHGEATGSGGFWRK